MIRYLSLAIGILVMALSGSLFSFASFSTDLKARFGFNSSNINLLSAIGDTSMYVGFLIVGPIYDHYGERWTMITAAVLTFLGYGGMYIAYAKAWGGLGFLMVLYCLAGVASTAGYLAALAANMANFPASTSGTVSGVLLAFFGLSATLFSQIKTHLFSGHDEVVDPTSTLKGTKATQTFLLFLTIITTAIYLIGAVFMVKIKKPVIKTLDSGSSSNATVNTSDIEKRAAAAAATPNASVTVQALSRSTTFTPSMKNGREGWNSSSTTIDKESTWFNPYLTSIDMKPRALLVESTFWFFVIAQVSQQGFSYINNVDSIVHAILDPLDPSTVTRAVSLTGLHVTLISIGNCLGRLASGILSDWVINRYRISRSIFFFVSEILILIPLIIMGFSTNVVSMPLLVISSCLIGATYGATGALFASMTRDFFGDTYYGTNCGMVMVLNGFNPIIANQVYGVFYDRAVKNQSPTHEAKPEDHVTCLGSACYDSSFKIASLLQVVCVVAAGLLFWAHMRKGRKLMQQNSPMA
ncbi:MAG: major facilitator superfamily domain-containing protein [Linnemannia gamsii]|nr:MAG: major facilitator superfamily domain-containing protein [Linnemannia gamsii]